VAVKRRDIERQKKMTQCWVIGGEHAGKSLGAASGGKDQWIGPLSDYALAREDWQRRSGNGAKARSVTRCRIERIDPDAPAPCTD
jgi:hypothetical protein